MKSNSSNPQSGFSLIELLIVLVILGVITTLAVLTFSSSKTDFERQRIVREFKVYLERARFDSVKRRPENATDMASVTLNGPTSFTARIDFNEDRVISANEARLVSFSDRSQTQIQVTDTLNYPVVVRFNRRGHVIATDSSGNAVTPLFRICSDCSDSSPDVSVISVSATGTVATMRNEQVLDDLPSPNTSNSSPIINCYVLGTNVNSNKCVSN